MKPLDLDQFKEFTFLSALNGTKDGRQLFFIRTRCDMEENGYQQQLMGLDPATGNTKEITEWKKRLGYMVLDDGVFFIVNDPEKKGAYSRFFKVTENGNEEAFTINLAVERMLDFDEDSWIVSATTNRSCPNYFAMSEEEKKAHDEEVKANEDYIVFDEYPFVFNGAGVVNGNRTSLFLVSKKDFSIKKITPDTFDVGSFELIGGDLIFSANDFTTYKTKWDKIYRFIKKTGKIECIFSDKMQIHKVFDWNGKIMVYGTFARDFGEMEAGKFYELINGKMELKIDTDASMHNSVGTDCHYGRCKNYGCFDGQHFFITTDEDHGVLIRLTDGGFEKVIDLPNGSIEDFVLTEHGWFTIAMLGQDLQEICRVEDNKATQITSFNKATFEGRYRAVPEKLTVKKAVDIDGWVLKPIDYDPKKKYPAILDIHGGPKTAYGEIYYHEMQYWSGQGYFVMFCNPRGSDGKGNFFADLRHQFGGIDYQDIMQFVDLVLETYPAIDPKRLGVTGGSYGGYMTNWIIGQTDRFACAATQRSISNWITEVGVSDYGIDFPIEQEFGDVRNCAAELWGMSPLKFVNRAKTPTLFIHSTEDYRCPVPEALQLYTALTCNGVETRMVLFKGENHELSRSGKPMHRIRRLTEITGWMNSHLK